MNRILLKSKIHCATLTGLELHYEGSIAIDEDLLDAADILPGEQVHVLNENNATRITTYAIKAPRGSGTMLLNGPAARLGTVGDKVVILAYAQVADEMAREYKATIVKVDDANKSL